MPLRDYQQDTIDSVVKSMKTGHRHIVVQQPPRTGKTVIMAEIAKRATAKRNRVLVVVHRQELVRQTQKTFVKWGVVMELTRVGMVQTLWRQVKRGGTVNVGDTTHKHHSHHTEVKAPQVIIIDEAHHALAKSYRTIVDAFPGAIVLMFTATPYRLSGAGMGEVADDLIQGLQVPELIKKGYLAPVKYFAPPDINTALLRRAKGEFTEQSIDEALKTRVYGSAVDQYKKHANGLKAIAYCHSVASAKRLAKEFNDNGITALEVDGATPAEKRADAVEQFKNGKVTVLTNVELFTEGLDLPNVDCVIQLRPTQSLSLFLQFSMRAMNPRKGKTAIILDHVGNASRFGLPTDERQWSLKGKGKASKKRDSVEQPPAIKTCPNCFGTFYAKDVVNDCCPLCHQPLMDGSAEEDEVVDGDLQEVKNDRIIKKRLARVHAVQKQNAMKEIAGLSYHELKTLSQLQLYGSAHGYKQGWAYYQAKERKII